MAKNFFFLLRILTWKKHPKIKLQRLRRIQIWTFRWLLHQIYSFKKVLKLERIFQKQKVVTGKTPLFVIGPLCSRHSICVNIGFWQSSFEWKWCFSILRVSTKKGFAFQKTCSKVKVRKTFETFTDCHIKTCRFLKRRVILKIPRTMF